MAVTTSPPASRRIVRSAAVPALLAALALAWVVAGLGNPEFRADSPGYFAYIRSLVFDGDLDFRNEWEHWGLKALPTTATGRMANPYPIGPALLWAPFFLVAH